MITTRFVFLLSLVFSTPLHAQTFSVLVKDGDTPTGGPAVITIDKLAVNSAGTWMVRASLSGSISVIVKNGSVFMLEGDALPAPAGASINASDDMTLNNLGTTGWNFFLNGTAGLDDDSGIFVDNTLIIQESDVCTAPQLTLGTRYIGFFGAKWNDARQMLVMASVDDTAIATTIDRALVLLQLDASNAVVSETVLMKEGDLIAGFGIDTVADFDTTPHSFALNNQGNAMWVVDTNATVGTDFGIIVDGAPLAREGFPSPDPGRNYELLNSKPVDISDGGHFAFRANLDGATADDEVIVVDNAIFVREGGSVPAIAPHTFTAFGSVLRVSAGGRVFWWGDWNDPDTTRDTGLFVDNTLLVQENVTMIGAFTVTTVPSVQDTFIISPDGRYVVFECVLNGSIDAGVMIDLGTPAVSFCFGDGSGTACPCANNGAIGRGCANSAFATGTFLTSSGNAGASAATDTLVLTANEVPGPGLFFQGDGQQAGGAGVAFGDGLLCVGGTLLRLGVVFPTGTTSSYPGGTTPNPIHVGGATAPGDVRHYQCWYRDALTFCTGATFNLTQALTVTWGP